MEEGRGREGVLAPGGARGGEGEGGAPLPRPIYRPAMVVPAAEISSAISPARTCVQIAKADCHSVLVNACVAISMARRWWSSS
jgi:hypothetical protein